MAIDFSEFRLFRKKGPVLGLDIGQEYITVTGLQKTSAGLRLINIARCPTPSGAIENGIILNSKEISKAIKALFRTKGINSRSVITALWDPRVLVHLAKIPSMSEDEMKEALKGEVDHYIIFAGAETVSDMCRLSEVTEEGIKNVRVLMGVAEKDTVFSYVKVVKDAGLDLVALDIDLLAVIRALYPDYLKTSPAEAVILVSIGHQNTSLSVLKAGILSYARTIELGIRDLVIIDEFTEKLTSELEAVLNYCKSEIGKVRKIVLSGNLEKIKGMDVRLGKRFEGTEIQVADPLTHIQYDKDTLSGDEKKSLSSATRAIGLAIRGVGVKEYPINIDILPLEEIRIKKFKSHLLKFFVSLGGIVILLLIALVGLRLQGGSIAFKALSLQRELEKPAPELSELLDIEKQTNLYLDEMAKQKDIISNAKKIRWDELLVEIKTVIPKDVRLTELKNKGDMVEFNGEALSQEAVFNFVKSLRVSPYFKEVKLNTAKDKEKEWKVYTVFNIESQIDIGGKE